MPKVAAIFTPPSDLDTPEQRELGWGNNATKFNKIKWEAACKVAEKTKDSYAPLYPELRIGYYRKSEGEGALREAVADPCARGAVKQALKRAQALVENNEAISAFVDGKMYYTSGAKTRARWSFGEWRRADGAGQLGRRRRR